ncbi:TlyA family rRNA (cytidine-2'-O)-methyltransferase [Vulcanibacillus modesticaldus]|uniref:TlyA family rRNA (Cytidine-2'-O)-methyltransferase n=1 Tax=Vulcanibacillus modesticaldus TaxID=337097 RepID=A0A1D2YRW4_9BACI|nr:TlyA family RNA methyltransferase [Vulcanibacillus modesticaldus]OEF95526.1 TlyA family rRNA (cytidine-2'-O)-methyltransferase [Vulcanibacillus modesticaldus]
MANKERLDVLVTNKGFFSSREQAKRSIMAGLVKVNNEIIDKPGTKVATDAKIDVKGNLHPFVSRGGLKLLKAIESFSIDMKDKVVLDIGASTGGFTDCSLQHGAKEVYAIDVGYGQLAWKLRQDERVHVMERTNFRYVSKEELKYSSPNFATIDVSFISLKTILAHLITLLDHEGEVVALVKPQFEAGRDNIGKRGIVKDPKTHVQVLESVVSFALDTGYSLLGLTFSPIKGGEGNIEFLIYLKKQSSNKTVNDYSSLIKSMVIAAHQKL